MGILADMDYALSAARKPTMFAMSDGAMHAFYAEIGRPQNEPVRTADGKWRLAYYKGVPMSGGIGEDGWDLA